MHKFINQSINQSGKILKWSE